MGPPPWVGYAAGAPGLPRAREARRLRPPDGRADPRLPGEVPRRLRRRDCALPL